MLRMTAWDANVYLCLCEILPEDVVKRMISGVKKTHEEFSLTEARDYWRRIGGIYIRGPFRRAMVESVLEFKKEWRYRSIEERQKMVIDWCKNGDEVVHKIHCERLTIRSPTVFYSNHYTKNLWKTWDTWSHSEGTPENLRTEEDDWLTPEEIASDEERRTYVSKWYEGVHPGRFFLFFKENEIFRERNRNVDMFIGVPGWTKSGALDEYVYPRCPIFSMGPYEQLIEDLKCLDGGGLGEKVRKTVEHIDDLFY